MSKKSTRVAIGGIFSGLCLLLMFLTALVPFSSYLMPGIAGAMLVAVVEENGRGTAVLIYISVSLLSLFIVPDPNAVVMFIAFFGYYAILQGMLARVQPAVLRMVLKLLLFNATTVGGYCVSIYLLGLSEMMEGLDDFGRWGPLLFLALGNLVFLLYDLVLTRYTAIYIHWFKPRYLRR